MFLETHRLIIRHALQFRRKHFKGFEQEIEKACVNEDYPNVSLDSKDISLFGLDHFYNPHQKIGYSKYVLDAKTKGIYLFKKALQYYKQGNTKLAFYTLGRSTHYLQDIASPSHTKLSFHFTEDDFERYVDENIHRFKFRIRAKFVPPSKPDECFEKLARKSYRVEYKKQNYMIGLFWNIFRRKKQPDPEKKLNKMSKKLIKASIIYTIALLNAFNRKIIRYNHKQKRKQLKDKIINKEKKLVKKLKQKVKKLK
ncbi:hypothetical protein GOV06_03440 [Candidatus Woesearchaeota archaeon]|nr:hypothetical protein [Candidatus Woesearchaeota archaeon]